MTARNAKSSREDNPMEQLQDPSLNVPGAEDYDRDSKIAELAYYKAESRGFEPGHELEDWIQAEQEFNSLH